MKNWLRPSLSIALLRILMGLVFMSHAMVRLVDYTLPGFGEFLNSKGFPAGFYLAWTITLFELLGGLLMVMRRLVKYFCIGEIIILLTGIVIVHAPNGWFVVGKTLGGAEYSVVLIAVLAAIYLAEIKEERNIRPVL
jgi:putative oxidoreductase